MQEYRKASAKKLGLDVHPFHYFYPKAEISPDEYLYYRNEAGGLPMWIPDEMADQMLMVWEWLKKHGGGKEVIPIFLAYVSKDESLFTATMKAFMEYIKQ